VVSAPQGEIMCRNIVNCAGLQCDRVARMCRVETGIQIVPFRGEYFDLLPHRRSLVKDPIYPVPDARYPFLGVHFTRGRDGTVEAGPNAVLAFARHGYSRDEVSPEDLASCFRSPDSGRWPGSTGGWG
jgi:L-2-hydroxyglutarate oxidase